MARAYDRTSRDEGARRTRQRILETAESLLVDEGFPALTIAALAAAAEVSPQTIYNSIGGKAAIVKALYDLRLAGDDEPVPMSERPAFVAMSQSADARAMLAAYVTISSGIYQRVGPLLGVLLSHRGDPVVAEFVETIESERRTGNGHFVEALRRRHGLPRGLTTSRAVDVVWTLTAPDVADRLLRACGWSGRAYERWLLAGLVTTMAPLSAGTAATPG